MSASVSRIARVPWPPSAPAALRDVAPQLHPGVLVLVELMTIFSSGFVRGGDERPRPTGARGRYGPALRGLLPLRRSARALKSGTTTSRHTGNSQLPSCFSRTMPTPRAAAARGVGGGSGGGDGSGSSSNGSSSSSSSSNGRSIVYRRTGLSWARSVTRMPRAQQASRLQDHGRGAGPFTIRMS